MNRRNIEMIVDTLDHVLEQLLSLPDDMLLRGDQRKGLKVTQPIMGFHLLKNWPIGRRIQTLMQTPMTDS